MSKTGKVMLGAILGLLLLLMLISAPAFAQVGDGNSNKCPDKCEKDTLYLKGYWEEKLRVCVYKHTERCKYGCDDKTAKPQCREFPDDPPTDEEEFDETIWNMVHTVWDNDRERVSVHIFGTEYQPADNGTVFLQLLTDDRQPVNDALCYLDIYYPNKTSYQNDATMTHLIGSDGLYYYDLVIPDTLGNYMISANCNFVYNLTYLMPTQDSYVGNGTYTNTNYGSSKWIYVGHFGAGTGVYYESLVQFDTSGVISNGIEKAEVMLYFDDYWWNPRSVTVHRVVSSWDEGTITWNTKPTSDTYEYDEVLPVIGWNSWDITDLVKGWANNTYVNYGLFFSFDTPDTYQLNQFRAKEFFGDTVPRLVIQYNSTEQVSEIRGSGELHVSDLAHAVYTTLATYPEPILLSNHDYCLDNTTLIKELTYEVCVNGKCNNITRNETQPCNYGCYNNACNPEPFNKALFLILLFIFIIGGIVVGVIIYDHFTKK